MTQTEEPTTHLGSERTNGILRKLPTGIGGFDLILNGGLPGGRMTIIQGGPGAGKTIFALEILYRGTQRGQPGIFVSFEESKADIRRNALSMGWDLKAEEEADRLMLIQPETQFGVIAAGDFSTTGLTAIVDGCAKKIGARVIVIDAVDLLMRLFEQPSRRFDELFRLQQWFVQEGFTVIFTIKSQTEDNQQQSSFQAIEFMADCVINLDRRVVGQVATRRLCILKYRGSNYAGNEHPYLISSSGIVLMPISSVELSHKPFGPYVSTGLPALDKILGRGYRQGASLLISGPSGTGKTTLLSTMAKSACERGEKVLLVSFEESQPAIFDTMKSVGIDLQSQVDEGMLKIQTTMPESLGVEEHLYRIFQAMDQFQPVHLFVDSISATQRMGMESAAFDFLIRLLSGARERGITCVYANQIGSTTPEDELSGVGISSLIDQAINLRYTREDDRIGRTLVVLKSRGSRHSDKYHRFRMTDDGMQILDIPDENR